VDRHEVRRGWAAALAVVCAAAGIAVVQSAGAYARPGVTTRVDLAPGGAQATVDPVTRARCQQAQCLTASAPVISADGKHVAFASYADNLVPHDTNHGPDIFVRDLTTGSITRASVSSNGVEQLWLSDQLTELAGLAISGDGRFVAFASGAPNLVVGDTNLATDLFVHDMATGTTTRVNVSTSGKQASAGVGFDISISSDGRYIAYSSAAADLVPSDTNGVEDVFVRDMTRGTTTRVSVTATGAQGDGSSGSRLSLSPSGRYIAFGSSATNLVAGDTNEQDDVFFRDLQKPGVELITVRPDGSPVPLLGGNSDLQQSAGWSISADGRYVLFGSNSMLLVPNDTNRTNWDVFVRDRLTHRTERISVASDGTDRQIGSGGESAITPDGRYVVFRTSANLDPDDRGACPGAGLLGDGPDVDVYLHDRFTGATELIGRSSSGAHGRVDAGVTTAPCQDSLGASISADGRKVVYQSTATNLVAHDTNNLYDVFLRQRGGTLGVGGVGPGSAVPTPSPTPSGVCAGDTCVSACVAGVCLPPLTATRLLSGRAVVRPVTRDVFLTADLARLDASSSADRTPLYGFELTAAGTRFQVRQQLGDPDFHLFRLNRDGWVPAGGGAGGLGTTGQSVVAAVPWALLGLRPGGQVTDVVAFVALGTAATGAQAPVEQMRLTVIGAV
jgi:Tol biopolymer transport system component